MKKNIRPLCFILLLNLMFSCSKDTADKIISKTSFTHKKTNSSRLTKSNSSVIFDGTITGSCSSTSSSRCGFMCSSCGAKYEATIDGSILLQSLDGNCNVCGSPFPEFAVK